MSTTAVIATPEAEYVTLPVLATEIRKPLDWLRRRFRTRPELTRLLRQVGPVRVLKRTDIEVVREMVG
jgi:hypothetical protein